MDEKIIATFCLCDDLLKAIHHHESSQCQMSDAEVMTTALVAALFFGGKHESARAMLKQYGYIPQMLSKSRFSRRLHRVKMIFVTLFDLLGYTWKTLNVDSTYIIDSVPISVCDNIRIPRSKIYRDEKYRGYQASKKRYFYGLKIHPVLDHYAVSRAALDEVGDPAHGHHRPGDHVEVADEGYEIARCDLGGDGEAAAQQHHNGQADVGK